MVVTSTYIHVKVYMCHIRRVMHASMEAWDTESKAA